MDIKQKQYEMDIRSKLYDTYYAHIYTPTHVYVCMYVCMYVRACV